MNELMDRPDTQVLFETRKTQYCSFAPKTQEERAAFFNLVNSPTERLKTCVNMEIKVRHVYAETCEFVSEDGEVTPGVRIILIDEKGKGYCAASRGIYNAVQKLFAIMGTPDTWTKPVTIIPRVIDRGTNNQVLTFDLKV